MMVPVLGMSALVLCSRTMRSRSDCFEPQLVLWSPVEPSLQAVEIDVEDEDFVEQIDELGEIAGAAAEEGDVLVPVGDQALHSTHVPDVVLVRCATCGLTSLRIALKGQFPITVERVVATSVQLSAHRGLASAGNAFDQVVAHAYRSSINPHGP